MLGPTKLVQKFPTVCPVKVAQGNVCNVARIIGQRHIHGDPVADIAGPMGGAAAGLAAVEIQVFVAPAIGDRVLQPLGQIGRRRRRAMEPLCVQPPTNRAIARDQKPVPGVGGERDRTAMARTGDVSVWHGGPLVLRGPA